jgi:hypothetical protein
MGYCPCFLTKNDPKSMSFAFAKIIENNLKGVKMSQIKIDQNHGL